MLIGSGYEKTEAAIYSIDQTDEDDYNVRVRYYNGDRYYIADLNAYSSGYKVGQTVKIKYNPNDPTDVMPDSPGFSIAFITPGVISIILGAVMLVLYIKSNRLKAA